MTIKLNCDLGESFGTWKMGSDEHVMAHIDQANIACGWHAGDPLIISQTLILARQYGVAVGAHPGYPDLIGFGRRSMKCSEPEIIAMIQYQVAALDGLATTHGLGLTYVKPHGALYHDMMENRSVRIAIMRAIAEYHSPLMYLQRVFIIAMSLLLGGSAQRAIVEWIVKAPKGTEIKLIAKQPRSGIVRTKVICE